MLIFYFSPLCNEVRYTAAHPSTAATSDVPRIAAFPIFTRFSLSKARPSMKMDMVNPIPAIIPNAKIWLHFVPAGSFAIRLFTAMKLKRKIPSGFPSSRPKKMPVATAGTGRLKRSPVIATPAFAKAKTGIMKYVTHG